MKQYSYDTKSVIQINVFINYSIVYPLTHTTQDVTDTLLFYKRNLVNMVIVINRNSIVC